MNQRGERRIPLTGLSFATLSSICGILYVFFVTKIYTADTDGTEHRVTNLAQPTGRSTLPLFRDSKTDQLAQYQEPSRSLRLFEDIRFGEFLNKGSINIVGFVELPDWWHETHDVPKSQKMLIKMTKYHSYAAQEIDALERLNSDEAKARQLKVLPLVAASRNISNPFYCPDRSKDDCFAFPDSYPAKVQKRLGKAAYVAVSIVPLREGRGFVYDELIGHNTTLNEVRIFLKSLLEQLALAHNAGVNNLDLSGGRNVYVDHDGSAILFDWNGAIALGAKSYNEEHAFSILPPEAWLKEVEGHELKMMSISGFDVWSVGIMLARIIFSPCKWTYQNSRHHIKDRLKETILALGGNTVIPVDAEFEIDLAKVAGISDTNGQQHGTQEFQPLLGKCSKTASFPLLDSAEEEEKRQVLDLLKSMMTISLLQRPDCNRLLDHPFFL